MEWSAAAGTAGGLCKKLRYAAVPSGKPPPVSGAGTAWRTVGAGPALPVDLPPNHLPSAPGRKATTAARAKPRGCAGGRTDTRRPVHIPRDVSGPGIRTGRRYLTPGIVVPLVLGMEAVVNGTAIRTEVDDGMRTAVDNPAAIRHEELPALLRLTCGWCCALRHRTLHCGCPAGLLRIRLSHLRLLRIRLSHLRLRQRGAGMRRRSRHCGCPAGLLRMMLRSRLRTHRSGCRRRRACGLTIMDAGGMNGDGLGVV